MSTNLHTASAQGTALATVLSPAVSASVHTGDTGYLVRRDTRMGRALGTTSRYHWYADVPLTSPGMHPLERGWLGGHNEGGREWNNYALGTAAVESIAYGSREEYDLDDDGQEVNHRTVRTVESINVQYEL